MVSISLNRTWVHNGEDYSDFVSVEAMIQEDPVVGGSVRMRAGGRKQAVRRQGRADNVTVDVSLATRDDVDKLRSWTGELVMVRDPRGRKLWGVYWSPPVTEVPAVDRANVRFTLEQVTFSEAV